MILCPHNFDIYKHHWRRNISVSVCC